MDYIMAQARIINNAHRVMDSKCVLWHSNACPGKAMCAHVRATKDKIESNNRAKRTDRNNTEREPQTEIYRERKIEAVRKTLNKSERNKKKQKGREKDGGKHVPRPGIEPGTFRSSV